MRGLKIFLLILLWLVVFIGVWAYLGLFSADNTLLNADYYDELFQETELVPRVYEEMSARFPELIQNSLETVLEEVELNTPEFNEIILPLVIESYWETIDPVWAEEQILLVIKDYVSVIRGEKETITAAIDTAEMEIRFRELLYRKIRVLPQSTVRRIELHPAVIEALAARIVREMGLFGEIQLADRISESDLSTNWGSTLTQYRFYRAYPYLPPIFLILMMIFMILLAKIAAGLRWFGSAVLLSSLSFLFCIWMLKGILPVLGQDTLNLEELPISQDLVQSVIALTADKITYFALISVGIGLALLVFGILFSLLTRKNPA
ncbi:MAG: hypothetical protein SCJ97_03245 [Bacillota bacterium]|nr:hypothetical protein [Bacillota bacterium]